MRSRRANGHPCAAPGALLAIFAILAGVPLVSAADEPAPASAPASGETEVRGAVADGPPPWLAVQEMDVQEAIEEVAADPALATERTERRLRWIGDGEEQVLEPPGWVKWIGELFGWIAAASRLLVWLLITLLVALLALYALRLAKSVDRKRGGETAAVPTHVRDLDIRPESLPDDIGAAAWALWERGERREAMSLLYRGLLSRLVHVHEVPIRDSSTEGDSLALAERHLPRARQGYVARLIRTWQHAVYGGNEPRGPEVRQLCEQFAAVLPTAETPAEVRA